MKGEPNDIKVALDIVSIPRLDEKDEVSIHQYHFCVTHHAQRTLHKIAKSLNETLPG